MEPTLTKNQKVVLSSIKVLSRKFGKSPTLKELQQDLGYSSTSSVQRHIDALKRKGVVRSIKNYARSLEINIEYIGKVDVPLVGCIACGKPIIAEENIDAYIPYNSSKLKGDITKYYFLRAVGDSMNNSGIDDGDFVLVRYQINADIGQIVVALIGDEATIKRLKRGDNHFILKPDSRNPKNKPLLIFDELVIQGVVVDVMKKGYP